VSRQNTHCYLLLLIIAKVHDAHKTTCDLNTNTCNMHRKQSLLLTVLGSIHHRDRFPLGLLFFDFESIFFFLLSFFMRESTTRNRPLTPGGRLTRLPTPFLPTTYVTFFFSDFNKPAFLYILSKQQIIEQLQLTSSSAMAECASSAILSGGPI